LSNADDTVKEMAKLAIISNRISEVHEKNMKTYPFIFFDGVKDVKIDYDLSNKANIDESDYKQLRVNTPTANHFVKYYLTINPETQNQNMDRRLTAIESAIRTLFWKNVTVFIYINDKLIFESKKRV
jgi:hypothetical protein